MIDYKDAKDKMGIRGIMFTPTQFSFALMMAIGMNKYEAYKIAFISEKLNKIDEEKMSVYEEKWKTECDIIVSQQNVKMLREYLREKYETQVSEDAFNIEDVNITPKQLKNILGKIIINSQRGGDDTSNTELLKIISEYMKSFAPSVDNEDFDRHFIQVLPPFNFICNQCNREGDAPMGLDFHCPHCGKLYKWSEEEKRYY